MELLSLWHCVSSLTSASGICDPTINLVSSGDNLVCSKDTSGIGGGGGVGGGDGRGKTGGGGVGGGWKGIKEEIKASYSTFPVLPGQGHPALVLDSLPAESQA